MTTDFPYVEYFTLLNKKTSDLWYYLNIYVFIKTSTETFNKTFHLLCSIYK